MVSMSDKKTKDGKILIFPAATSFLFRLILIFSYDLTDIDAFALPNGRLQTAGSSPIAVGILKTAPALPPINDIRVYSSCAKRVITDTTTSISSKNNDDNEDDQEISGAFAFLLARWERADLLEVRLDATLVACHVLCRFLVYDLTLPKKIVPGFEVFDIILLVDTFSSVAVLALLWTAAGLVTGIFEPTRRRFDPVRVVSTAALIGPVWIVTEIVFRWPPWTTAVYPASLITTLLVGVAGLCATMCLGRIAASMNPTR